MKRAADDETVESENANLDTNGNEQNENGSAPPLKKAKETDDSSPAPALPNVNALLSNLAAQKAALQAKLQQQKQHLQQEELLKKAITVKQLKDQKPEMNDVQKRFADLQARIKDKLPPKKEEPPKEQEKKEEPKQEVEKPREDKDRHREDRHREDKDRHRDDKDRHDRHRDDKDRHREDRHRDDKHRDDRHRDDKDRHREDRHRDDKDRRRDRDDKDRHRDDKDRHRDDKHRDDRHRDDKDRHRDDKDRHRDDRHRDDKHRDDKDRRRRSGESDKRRSRDEDRRRKEKKPESEKDRFIPPPLRLDDKGREVDEQGNLIKQESQNIATLKLNLKTKKKKEEPIFIQKEEPKKQVFYDPNLAVEAPERKRRALTFVEPGSILKKAEKIRAKSRGEYVPEEPKKQDKQLDSKAESTIIAANMPELDLKIAKKLSKEAVPEIEWWDKYLLYQENYEDIEKFKGEEVTHYIEHPVPLKPIGEKDVPPMPMFLTDKERKKLRRTTRREREREKQEQIILGIMEPPKPKVRLANLMRVLGTEATADPTQIEQEVKRQMAERVAAHDARNQANKLTKEEKKAKKKQKFEDDLKKSVFVLAFKVGDLSHPKLKFKVDATARENGLGGCAILTKENNLVLVEGGQKSIRKFKKVMLTKVKWNEEKKEEENENEEKLAVEKVAGKENKCILLWEGNVTKPNFNGQFRFEGLPSEDAIRKYLNHRWSEHYWDMCKNYKEEDHTHELLPI